MTEMSHTPQQQDLVSQPGHDAARPGAQQQDEYDEVLAFAADIDSDDTEG
jgi:hypothetical protein